MSASTGARERLCSESNSDEAQQVAQEGQLGGLQLQQQRLPQRWRRVSDAATIQPVFVASAATVASAAPVALMLLLTPCCAQRGVG